MRLKLLVGLLTSLLLALFPGVALVHAQEQQPQNQGGLSLVTAYPSQEIALGESVTIELQLRAPTAQIVRLELQGLPEGWNASFRGGSRVVQSVYVQPDAENKVELRVEPPRDAAAGPTRLTVIARGDQGEARLPLELIVKEKAPPRLTFETDLPTLKGTPETNFRYTTTLRNEGDEDLSVTLSAEAPEGFQVTFETGGQDVTSFPLAANESKTITVQAQPFSGTAAGSYPIKVRAQAGEVQAELDLTAEVTGQPQLNLTAPDGRLSGQAYIGRENAIKLVLQNTGSAPARDVELTASPPAGWQVRMDPERIAELGPNQQQEVTAYITPSDQAIAGDYMITFSARPADGAAKTAEFRVTVLTSTMWGIVGVGLIAVAVGVIGMAVMRFGRR